MRSSFSTVQGGIITSLRRDWKYSTPIYVALRSEFLLIYMSRMLWNITLPKQNVPLLVLMGKWLKSVSCVCIRTGNICFFHTLKYGENSSEAILSAKTSRKCDFTLFIYGLFPFVANSSFLLHVLNMQVCCI